MVSFIPHLLNRKYRQVTLCGNVNVVRDGKEFSLRCSEMVAVDESRPFPQNASNGAPLFEGYLMPRFDFPSFSIECAEKYSISSPPCSLRKDFDRAAVVLFKIVI